MKKIINFSYCSQCSGKPFCCGNGEPGQPELTKKERINLKSKYGVCYDKKNELLRQPDGKCIFLTDKGCRLKIKDKPFVCRLYPIYIEEGKYGLDTPCFHGAELIKRMQTDLSIVKYNECCRHCTNKVCASYLLGKTTKEHLIYPFMYKYTKKGNPKRKEYNLDIRCLFAVKLIKELTNRRIKI